MFLVHGKTTFDGAQISGEESTQLAKEGWSVAALSEVWAVFKDMMLLQELSFSGTQGKAEIFPAR